MNSKVSKFISVISCVAVLFASLSIGLTSFAASQSQLQNDIARLQNESKAIQKEINALKSQKSNQAAILAAIQKKIANTQAQISRCNQEIGKINDKINENKAQIAAKEREIEASKLAFKKRLRAIYMSDSDSNVKILLGAESFSDYLQLAQLTSSVSSHDEAIINDIVAAIDLLNEKNKENEALLNEQVSVRASVQAQQSALESEEAEAQALYNSINNEQKQTQTQKDNVDAQIKRLQRQLEDEFSSHLSGGSTFINPNSGLMWPTTSRTITAGYNSNDSIHKGVHKGIDIGAAYRSPVYAIADGDVYQTYNSCTHRSKSPMCSCGNGYGNNVRIDHGIIKGTHYGAIYAHLDQVVVSAGQHVKQGQLIGYVGTTGQSTGYHLHLGLWVGSKEGFVDPYPYFYQ